MISSRAIYARLSGDTAVSSLLSTYKGAPAVFTTSPVPHDAKTPYVVIVPASTGEWLGSKTPDTNMSYGITHSILVAATKSGSAALVDEIAMACRRSLSDGWVPLIYNDPVSGETVEITTARPFPEIGADTGELYGREIDLELTIHQGVSP